MHKITGICRYTAMLASVDNTITRQAYCIWYAVTG